MGDLIIRPVFDGHIKRAQRDAVRPVIQIVAKSAMLLSILYIFCSTFYFLNPLQVSDIELFCPLLLYFYYKNFIHLLYVVVQVVSVIYKIAPKQCFLLGNTLYKPYSWTKYIRGNKIKHKSWIISSEIYHLQGIVNQICHFTHTFTKQIFNNVLSSIQQKTLFLYTLL